MRRFEFLFTFIQLPLDFVMLVLAGITAYSLRFSQTITTYRPVLFEDSLPWDKYWPLVLTASLIWIFIFAINGLYHTNPNRKLLKDAVRLFFASATGFALITVYIFFSLQKFDSRFLVLAGTILSFIYVLFGRVFIKGIKILLYKKGLGLRRTVIIGTEKIGIEIKESLERNKGYGYRVIGIYENFNTTNKKELLKLKPNEIILTNPKANEKETLELIDFCNEEHIIFKYSADLFSTISANMPVYTVAGVPIIELKRTNLAGWGSIIKRFFDIFGSILLIILFSPIFIITTLMILIETGRPIIFKNERVGFKNIKFFTLKFRSMHKKDCTGEQFGKIGEEALKKEKELITKQNVKTGPIYKIKNDPRVTSFGHFIRRWSIDELPQFFNVLKGNMSLVGPRPHQQREVEQYEKHHKAVLDIKPGITGLAQISGRSNLNFEEEIKLDTVYMEEWNILLDLIILIKTPFIVIKNTGAW